LFVALDKIVIILLLMRVVLHALVRRALQMQPGTY